MSFIFANGKHPQSKESPFANTKARKDRKQGKDASSKSVKPKKYTRWVSFIKEEALSRKRVLLPVKKLRNSFLLSSEMHRTLYGFIVFEVAWSNVRGINYLNELQTDTSLATEAKFMQRWEFDSIAQAANCISSWFSGTVSEKRQLGEYLDSLGAVNKDWKLSIPQLAGAVWEACFALKKTPATNVIEISYCNCSLFIADHVTDHVRS